MYFLDPASASIYIAQALDSSGVLKKTLITNKVTTCFFNTPAKPMSYTLHARSPAGSRYLVNRHRNSRGSELAENQKQAV